MSLILFGSKPINRDSFKQLHDGKTFIDTFDRANTSPPILNNGWVPSSRVSGNSTRALQITGNEAYSYAASGGTVDGLYYWTRDLTFDYTKLNQLKLTIQKTHYSDTTANVNHQIYWSFFYDSMNTTVRPSLTTTGITFGVHAVDGNLLVYQGNTNYIDYSYGSKYTTGNFEFLLNVKTGYVEVRYWALGGTRPSTADDSDTVSVANFNGNNFHMSNYTAVSGGVTRNKYDNLEIIAS